MTISQKLFKTEKEKNVEGNGAGIWKAKHKYMFRFKILKYCIGKSGLWTYGTFDGKREDSKIIRNLTVIFANVIVFLVAA